MKTMALRQNSYSLTVHLTVPTPPTHPPTHAHTRKIQTPNAKIVDLKWRTEWSEKNKARTGPRSAARFCNFWTFVITNVNKITRLLFPVFGKRRCCMENWFSHQVTSRGHSKMELFSWKFLSALVTSLDGKSWKIQFSMECGHGAKTRE